MSFATTGAGIRRTRRLFAAGVVGYLLGTFPTADLVARRMSRGSLVPVDLRTAGSGNPGGMNVLHLLGARAGVTVMAGDIVKGAAACAIGGAIAGPAGAHLAGSSSVVGHCLPVWNGGRGGKGVATSVGQCLATFPAYAPIDLAVAGLTMTLPRWKRRTFAATMVSSACWVIGACVWWRRSLPNLWGPRPSPALPLAALASSAMVVSRFLAARRSEQVAA